MYQDPAFAIQYLAACRQDGNVTDAVLFRQLRVVIGTDYLQAPQTESKYQEHPKDAVLDSSQANLRYFFFAPECHKTSFKFQSLNPKLLSIYSGLDAAVPPLDLVSRMRSVYRFANSGEVTRERIFRRSEGKVNTGRDRKQVEWLGHGWMPYALCRNLSSSANSTTASIALATPAITSCPHLQ